MTKWTITRLLYDDLALDAYLKAGWEPFAVIDEAYDQGPWIYLRQSLT